MSLQPTAPIAIAAAASAAIVTYLFLRQNKKAEAEPCCADDDDAARSTVFRAYEATAQGNASCCVTAPVGGSNKIGYTAEAQALGAATGADLGLGCGTPVELAALQKGETVCDLGAGGGFDVLGQLFFDKRPPESAGAPPTQSLSACFLRRPCTEIAYHTGRSR